ncbi:hypothetical protein M9H77_36055 [Catharanthus roseus]|uniref:Uncharacterized protein n=1 Tax=Catharanthus roseus TaxID=4058 RepID=A0ACB9ZUG3_CATRO|nr:hypothetical protein M9H77_36055 [Catharanthus roseus]
MLRTEITDACCSITFVTDESKMTETVPCYLSQKANDHSLLQFFIFVKLRQSLFIPTRLDHFTIRAMELASSLEKLTNEKLLNLHAIRLTRGAFVAHFPNGFFSTSYNGMTNSNYLELNQLYQKYMEQGCSAYISFFFFSLLIPFLHRFLFFCSCLQVLGTSLLLKLKYYYCSSFFMVMALSSDFTGEYKELWVSLF